MKKILLSLLFTAAITSFVCAADVRGEVGNLKWLLRNGEMSITGATVSKSEVTTVDIPATIEGKAVTRIFAGAFKACTNLSEVKLPNSITVIEKEAFSGCKNLTEVKLPTALTLIGQQAFMNCGLTEITIPVNVKTIEKEAFRSESLMEIKILNAPVSIEDGAFRSCFNLISVDLGNKVVRIGDNAFENYKLDSFTMPDSVKSIGKAAFKNAKNLNSIVLSKSLQTIGDNAFTSCENLKELIIPDTVTTIGKKAFSDCKKLEKLKLSANLKTVPTGMCMNCEALKEIIIPDSVVNVDSKYAESPFYGCYSLENVVIGKSVKTLNNYLFNQCKQLKSVVIPDSVKTIGTYVFAETAVEKIIIPDSVISIGEYAFYDCKNLCELKYSANVKKIPKKAFFGCVKLESFPDNVEEFEDESFYGCVSLKEIKIKPNIVYGKHVFGASWSPREEEVIPRIIICEGVESFNDEIFNWDRQYLVVNEIEFGPTVKTTNEGNIYIRAKIINNFIIDNPDFTATTTPNSMRIEHLKCYKSVYDSVFGDEWAYIHIVEFFDSDEKIVKEYKEIEYK